MSHSEIATFISSLAEWTNRHTSHWNLSRSLVRSCRSIIPSRYSKIASSMTCPHYFISADFDYERKTFQNQNQSSDSMSYPNLAFLTCHIEKDWAGWVIKCPNMLQQNMPSRTDHQLPLAENEKQMRASMRRTGHFRLTGWNSSKLPETRKKGSWESLRCLSAAASTLSAWTPTAGLWRPGTDRTD